MLLSDYTTQVQFLVHDQTNADFTQAELTNAINNARTAVALDFHCVREMHIAPPTNAPPSSIYRPVGLITNVEAYPLRGPNGNNAQVVGIVVLAGGSNYTAATTITFPAGPAGSVRATGTPIITAGAITGVNMTTWGLGYDPTFIAAPSVVDSGGGSGASVITSVFFNVINPISISCIWGNQRYMLKFRGFTLFQAYMRSLTTFNSRPIIWTIHEQSGTVLIAPPPDQPYVSEWDNITLPLPLIAPSDTDTYVLPPWNDAVQYYAASLCLNKLQNFEQANHYMQFYSARVPKIIIGAGGVRIPNPYHKTFQRRVSR